MSKSYLQKLSSAVSKRSGICQATIEQVLPALFDEIRFQLSEGSRKCVPIDSFGTFAVVNIPEREYHYTYKCDKIVRLPAKKRMKFLPTRSFRKETEKGVFDRSRTSFSRHPDDPMIRKRVDMSYRRNKNGVFKGRTKVVKKNAEDENTDIE